jgi:CRISPR/Cas system-associated exonuclease Cas4 (RecB family)
VQKEFGLKAENIKAALYYLEDEVILSSSYDEESLDKIEKELLEVYNKIESHKADEARGNTGSHCNRCEYKDMCPFFKNKNSISSLPKNLR